MRAARFWTGGYVRTQSPIRSCECNPRAFTLSLKFLSGALRTSGCGREVAAAFALWLLIATVLFSCSRQYQRKVLDAFCSLYAGHYSSLLCRVAAIRLCVQPYLPRVHANGSIVSSPTLVMLPFSSKPDWIEQELKCACLILPAD